MNIIIDINNAFYKSYFIYREIYGKDKPIVRKLLFHKFMTDLFFSIRMFSKHYPIDKVICCCDGENNFRKQLLTTYKVSRSKKEQEFYDTMQYARNYLKEIGFIVSHLEGFEADDMVGLWNSFLEGQMNTIFSNDEDIRQLVDNYTHVYNNQAASKKMYIMKESAIDNFLELELKDLQYSVVNPDYILFEKLLRGCKGDEVPDLMVGRIMSKKLNLIFEEIKFNRKDVTYEDLKHLLALIYRDFKNQTMTLEQLQLNLKLVHLSDNSYNLYDYERAVTHISESIYTYKDNFEHQFVENL